jgi:hypothetical protein
MVPEEHNSKRPETPNSSVGQYLGYGLAWAASTIGFLLLGSWLDGKLGSKPALTLIGAFVGAAAGFYSMYHNLVVVPKQTRRDRDKDH